MLPDNAASSIGVPALLSDPDTRVTTPLVDYEMGGAALNDASQGLQVKPWMLYMAGVWVTIKPANGGTAVQLFSRVGVTELALAFDQNMRPAVAFMQSNQLWLRWYDPVTQGFVLVNFGEGRSPRLTLDDKRPSQLGPSSDMILAYIRGNALYYRQQRDRFLIERLLHSDLIPNTILRAIGMGKNLRLQFELILL